MQDKHELEEIGLDEYDESIDGIVDEYKKKRLLEDLSGPSVSLILHILILTLMFIILVKKVVYDEPIPEVNIVEELIKTPDRPDPENHLEDKPDVEVETVPVEDPQDKPEPDNPEKESDTIKPQTEDNKPDDPQVREVVAWHSPMQFSLPGGMRSPKGRKEAMKRYKGLPGNPNAVNKGLVWLARVQNSDGSWGDRAVHARTGLALMCFLAHGETHLSPNYSQTVIKAFKWLSAEADKGIMGNKKAYEHGIASYAIAEAYGMTQLPILRRAMEKSIQYVIDGQQNNGGFDYGYRDNGREDMSVSGWNIQALKSAYMSRSRAKGLAEAIKKSVIYTKRSHKDSDYGGEFYYSGENTKANMTGIGVVSLQFFGEGHSKEAKAGIYYISSNRFDAFKKVQKDPGSWDKMAGENLYGWYYDTQAAFNQQGALWDQWSKVFQVVLIKAQSKEGYWEIKNKKHGMGPDLNGRVITTCWSLLQLEVFYKYLPTFDNTKLVKFDLAKIKPLGAENDQGVIEFQN
jgi:hypothetical protein